MGSHAPDHQDDDADANSNNTALDRWYRCI